MPGSRVHNAPAAGSDGSIGTSAYSRSKIRSRGGSRGAVRTCAPCSVIHWAYAKVAALLRTASW